MIENLKNLLTNGALIGASSGISYAGSEAFAKLLTGRIDSPIISFSRTLVIFMFAVVFMIWNKKREFLELTRKDLSLLIPSGVINMTVIIIQNHVLQMISISDAITLMASSPIFVIFINSIISRKLPKIIQVVIVIICITGIILCAQPSFIFDPGQTSKFSIFNGHFLALFAAVILAIMLIMLKNLDHLDIWNFILMENIIGLLIMTVYIPLTSHFDPRNGSLKDYSYLAANSLLSLAATYLLYTSLRYSSALLTSVGKGAEIVTGIIFSIALFKSGYNCLSIVGGLIVTLSIIIESIVQMIQDCCSKTVKQENLSLISNNPQYSPENH